MYKLYYPGKPQYEPYEVNEIEEAYACLREEIEKVAGDLSEPIWVDGTEEIPAEAADSYPPEIWAKLCQEATERGEDMFVERHLELAWQALCGADGMPYGTWYELPDGNKISLIEMEN